MKTKKEIRQEYKEKVFPKGVFRIRNLVNGKIYIGSAMNLDVVWNSQRYKLNSGIHFSKALQKEWDEFGEDKFVFEIVDVLKENPETPITDKDVKQIESLYIEELQPFGERGYNKQVKKSI